MPLSQRSRLERSTFLVLFALAAYGFWRTLEPLWVPLLLGMVIAVGAYPLHVRLLRRMKGRHAGLSAALLTAVVMVLLLCVIAFLLLVVGHRALVFARELSARYQHHGAAGVLGPDVSRWLERFGIEPGQLGERVGAAASDIAAWAGGAATSIVAGLFTAIFTFIFTALTSYYLLREGEDGTSWLVKTLPLADRQVRQIVRDVRDVTRAMMLSTGLVALYQGVTSGIGYWMFGVESPMVWASLTGIASLLPAVGTAMIWAPVCAVLAMTGHVGRSLGVLAWSIVVVVFVADYILRPKLVGTRMKMNDLLVFIAIFGGIEAFGVMGVLLGPIAVAVLLSLVRIYQHDYRPAEAGRVPPDATAANGGPVQHAQ